MIVSLLYGCGLTVNECLALRIQDIDLESQEITVTNYRTQKKRKLAIPYILKEEMSDRINKLRYRYMYLTLKDYRGVTLPGPVRMTAPESGKSFAWFYLFPAVKPLHTSADGSSLYHHRCATYVQKAVRKALKAAGIKKKASCHSFRHSYASHLLKDGRNISEVQKLLGHNNIRSTMLYMAILKFQSRVSDSPLDNL